MDDKDKVYDIDGLIDWPSTGQISRSAEALAEWRSSEQVDNGTPSTSPPIWETENDSDDEFKPSEMYGKFTWKIEKFSQLSKKELKSEVFEVNGYKWYILIYPQGCDVCNHLSLFLCVADHTQLLPGWGHFAQFTLEVVNKDSKKNKYSDTLHRFGKKEHDWGWKKFIELSKVQDGFLIDDTLTIKAQVQIIRNNPHRPFRCLDRQYRRELLGAYLSQVEQVCRKFVEDQKSKLRKLLKDKARWSSFCTFWSGMDPSVKQQMSRERADVLLKVVVKHFFVEKEVTSALVMDSLYRGLKAFQMESKFRGGKENVLESVSNSRPIVYMDGDMFILADDLLSLLAKSPRQSVASKDDKDSSSQSKAGSTGQDFTKDLIGRAEKRLTEFGCRTIEMFALSHIFSQKIEIAFQEAVAARIQEELIREEEEAREAELEKKAKRQAADKEKRLKKKMNKQKRSRNGKGQQKDEKSNLTIDEHDNSTHTSGNAMGLSEESTLHSSGMSNHYEGDPDLRDDDDDASVWLTVEDLDGSHVTEDSTISDTCLSGESSTTEQGVPYFNESMSSSPTDGVQQLESNVWCEDSVSDNGGWNVSVRKKNQRHKVISEQIKRTVEPYSELAVITNGSRRGSTRSGAYHSTHPELDGSLKDHALKLPHVDQIERSTSQEGIEGSSKQCSVPEASHIRVDTKHVTSNMNPNVRRNGIQIQTSVRSEASATLQLSSEGSLKKSNGDIPRQRLENENLKPLSEISSKPLSDQSLIINSRAPSVSQADPSPKAEAPKVGALEQLPNRAACSSPAPQLHRNLNMPKAQGVSGRSLLPASNGSVCDPALQRSLTPPVTLPLENSANDLVTELTFGFLTRQQLTSFSSSPRVLESPGFNDSPSSKSIGLTAGSTYELLPGTTPSQIPKAPIDDFPHIDIINYLFEEETENGQSLNSPYFGTEAGQAINGGMYELPLFSYSPGYESFSRQLDNNHANGLLNVNTDRQVEFPVHTNGHIDETMMQHHLY
ncbi:unnamed protein product [Rhodiola kirilowii]